MQWFHLWGRGSRNLLGPAKKTATPQRTTRSTSEQKTACASQALKNGRIKMASQLWQAHNREERLLPVVGAASRSPPLPFGSGLASNARWVQSALLLEKKLQGINQQAVGCEWGGPEHGGGCWRPGFDCAPFLIYTYLATFHSEDLVDSVDAHSCVITGLSELEWWRGANMIGIMVEPLWLTALSRANTPCSF